MLTKKKKNQIAKMLAAIYYTAVHWNEEEWADFVKCIVGNCAEIAFLVGGERMMNIEVPTLVINLNERLGKKNAMPPIIEVETCNNSKETCNKTDEDAVNASLVD